MTILCGTDFSESAEQAVEVASCIALHSSQALELMHVLVAPVHSAQDQALRDAEVRLEAQAAGLRARGVDTRVHVASGQPAEALLARAKERPVTWIVVGAHGEGRSHGSRLGRQADALAAQSHLPVLVVRDPSAFQAWKAAEQPRPLRVLLGADASTTTAAALRFIDALRTLGPCDVNALHLFWPPEVFQRLGFGGTRSFLQIDPEVRKAIGDELVARFGSLPVEVSPHLGAFSDGLAQAGERMHADLIVVGTHGRGPLERIADESVSHGLLRRSTLNVACVPAVNQVATPRPLRSVVVATDLSGVGNAAITLAYSAVAPGGVVHVVHVVPAPEVGVLESTDLFALEKSPGPQPIRDEAHAAMRKALPALGSEKTCQTQLHVLQSNDVAEAIAQAAERLHADVVCVGTHGRGGLVSALLGSVALGVLGQTTRPVLFARVPR